VGTDGVRDPGRVAAVLSKLDADVVGLQEVASHAGAGAPAQQLEYLAERTGTSSVYGPTLLHRGGEYGSGIVTQWPVQRLRRHDLSVPGLESRGGLAALLTVGKASLRIVVTHLDHPAQPDGAGLGRPKSARALGLRSPARRG
jgi:endonuclease/exonuclease/phosphatase family metal-dependent hydrolase